MLWLPCPGRHNVVETLVPKKGVGFVPEGVSWEFVDQLEAWILHERGFHSAQRPSEIPLGAIVKDRELHLGVDEYHGRAIGSRHFEKLEPVELYEVSAEGIWVVVSQSRAADFARGDVAECAGGTGVKIARG
jgi:hypothetical protein